MEHDESSAGCSSARRWAAWSGQSVPRAGAGDVGDATARAELVDEATNGEMVRTASWALPEDMTATRRTTSALRP